MPGRSARTAERIRAGPVRCRPRRTCARLDTLCAQTCRVLPLSTHNDLQGEGGPIPALTMPFVLGSLGIRLGELGADVAEDRLHARTGRRDDTHADERDERYEQRVLEQVLARVVAHQLHAKVVNEVLQIHDVPFSNVHSLPTW